MSRRGVVLGIGKAFTTVTGAHPCVLALLRLLQSGRCGECPSVVPGRLWSVCLELSGLDPGTEWADNSPLGMWVSAPGDMSCQNTETSPWTPSHRRMAPGWHFSALGRSDNWVLQLLAFKTHPKLQLNSSCQQACRDPAPCTPLRQRPSGEERAMAKPRSDVNSPSEDSG